jgi:hypothetical protein
VTVQGSVVRVVRLLVVVVLLAACGGDDDDATVRDADATTSTSPTEAEDVKPKIGFDALADAPAGQTLREVGHVEVTSFEDFGGFCFYAVPDGLAGRAVLTVLSPDGQPMQYPLDGVIGRASSHANDPDPLGTDRVAIGDSEDDVREAYDDHEIVESPHKYVEGGHYLDVQPGTDDPDGSLLRFETDGTVVTAIHGGTDVVVQLVEGCA